MTGDDLRRGQVALVTGGSQGIGFAVAHTLLSVGMSVAIVARDHVKLNDAVTQLERVGPGRVIGVPADVADEASVASAVTNVVSRLGGIDVLVTSAGTSMRAPKALVETSTQEWTRLVDANLTGTYFTVRAVLAEMERASSGYVITIMSTAAFHAGAQSGLYAATKFGVRALTESLIEEYRGTGIRISSISPGPVDTSIWDLKVEPPTDSDRAHMLRPDDIAQTVAWLLSRPPHMHIQDITVTPWTTATQGRRTGADHDANHPPASPPARKGPHQ